MRESAKSWSTRWRERISANGGLDLNFIWNGLVSFLKVSQVCHQMHLWHPKGKIFHSVGNPRSKHSRTRKGRIQLSRGRSELFSPKVSGRTTQLRGREDGHMARMSEKLCRMWTLQLLYVAKAEQCLCTFSKFCLEAARSFNCFWTKGMSKEEE